MPQQKHAHIISSLPTTSAMLACGKALWESLLTEPKHELDTLAATWQSRPARRIEAGMQASPPGVSDDEDDPRMETGFDVTKPERAPDAGFTMEQA